MIIEKYCSCGNELHVDVNRRKRQQTLIVWYNAHHGSGHGDTNADGARAARTGFAIPGKDAQKEQA